MKIVVTLTERQALFLRSLLRGTKDATTDRGVARFCTTLMLKLVTAQRRGEGA